MLITFDFGDTSPVPRDFALRAKVSKQHHGGERGNIVPPYDTIVFSNLKMILK